MTTELTKAAQQAHTPEHIAGVDHAHELLRRMGYHRDGDWFIHVNRRGAEAIHISTISTIVNAGQMALTQRPAAQTEREADERKVLCDGDIEELAIFHAPPIHPDFKDDDDFIEFGRAIERKVIQRLIASLPAPQQATPEPVGEPFGWLFQHEETGRVQVVDSQQVEWGFETNNQRWQKIRPVYTHPAPCVPDAEDLRDRLVAISSAVADRDDRAAQSMLSETLRLLAAAQAKGGV